VRSTSVVRQGCSQQEKVGLGLYSLLQQERIRVFKILSNQ